MKNFPFKKVKEKIIPYLTKKNIVIGLLVILLVVQYFQTKRLLNNFLSLEGRDSSLISEIGQLNDTYQKVGQDLNEVRSYLRLPIGDYPGIEHFKDEDEDMNQLQLALFQYVDSIASEKSIEKNLSKNGEFLDLLSKADSFGDILVDHALSASSVLQDENGISLVIKDNELGDIIVYSMSFDDGLLFVETPFYMNKLDYDDVNAFLEKELKFIDSNSEKLKEVVSNAKKNEEALKAAIASEAVIKVLNEFSAYVSTEPYEKDYQIIYEIFNKSSELMAKIIIDIASSNIYFVDLDNKDHKVNTEHLADELKDFLDDLDLRGYMERKVDKAKEELEEAINDGGFEMLLKQSGLRLEGPREDEFRIYYDLYYANSHISSIIFDKATGVTNIGNPDGTNLKNVLFFESEESKKKL